MNDYIVGIDIGASKVCGAVGRIDRQGKLQILGVASEVCNGIKKAMVIDIDYTAQSISGCVKQLERIIGTEIKHAFISLPGGICDLVLNNGVIAISSKDHEIDEHDINRVQESTKVIPIPSEKLIIGLIPQQYTIDDYNNVKDPLGMSGTRLELKAQVIIAQTNLVTNICKCVAKAGLSIEGITLQPMAEAQVVLKNEERKIGAAIIDVGADTMELSIFKNGDLVYNEIVPYGGNSITNDLSLCLKISNEEAEKIKIKADDLKTSEQYYNEKIKLVDNNEVAYNQLVDIIEARVEELLYIAKIKFSENRFWDNVLNVVIVGGGISLFKGISSLAKDILDKPVRIGISQSAGVTSPIHVASIGIVQEIANSIKDPDLKKRNEEYSNNENSKRKNDIIVKIKNFLSDFF